MTQNNTEGAAQHPSRALTVAYGHLASIRAHGTLVQRRISSQQHAALQPQKWKDVVLSRGLRLFLVV